MSKVQIYSCFFFLLFSQSLIAGGGWPQPKGNGYFKLYEWWIVSDQHFTNLGKIDPNQTTGIYNTSLYAEYGFTNQITGIVNFPFFSRTYFNNQISKTTGDVITPGESLNGVGDAEIGIKYGFAPNSRIPVAASIIFGLPLGNDAGGSQQNLQTGDGEFNQLVRIDAGTGIPIKSESLSAYANAYIGFNNRTKGFSDEFRYGLEAGLSLLDNKFLVIGRLNAVKSLKNGSATEDVTSTSIFANNTEYTNLGVELAYNINEKFGVSVSYDTALSGKIIFASPAYSVGVFYNLRK